jgi:hypothetical protein
MDQIQSFISTHNNLLLAILRTLCILTSIMMTYSSFCALFCPSTFAELMGIPFQIQAPSKNPDDKTPAFLIQFAWREFALALILGILVYLDEIKVLSWVLLAIGVADVANEFPAATLKSKVAPELV